MYGKMSFYSLFSNICLREKPVFSDGGLFGRKHDLLYLSAVILFPLEIFIMKEMHMGDSTAVGTFNHKSRVI